MNFLTQNYTLRTELKRKQNPSQLTPSASKPSWFVGLQTLVNDKNIRLLNISRFLNNLAYATWMTTFPFFLAKIAHGDKNIFAQEQGIATSLAQDMSVNRAHDILWTFTGRDMYRMLVIE